GGDGGIPPRHRPRTSGDSGLQKPRHVLVQRRNPGRRQPGLQGSPAWRAGASPPEPASAGLAAGQPGAEGHDDTDRQGDGLGAPNWLTDPALASVRDRTALAKLANDERQAWKRLWADVEALVADDPLQLGRIYAARREWGQAADCYARALRLSPTDDGQF